MHVDIIKGNAGEISTIAKIIGCDTESIAMRGVDSIGSGFTDPSAVVRAVAKRESKSRHTPQKAPTFLLSLLNPC